MQGLPWKVMKKMFADASVARLTLQRQGEAVTGLRLAHSG